MVAMTDLLSRPPHLDPDDPRRRGGRRGGGAASRLVASVVAGLRGEQERTLAGAAALAAGGAVAAGLLGLMAVALVGWYLADGGAHGSTRDALRAGADLWLVGHGSGVSLGGVPVGLVPLALPVALGWLAHRLAVRAGRTARPTDDDRTVVQAAVTFTGVYLVLAVLTCVLAGTDDVSPGLGRTVLGALLLPGLLGTLGLVRGTGRLGAWRDLVPGWVRAVVHGATTAVVLLLGAAAALALVAVLLGTNDAMAVLAGLRLSGGDYAAYAVATALLLPNAVLWAAAYLVGPGFSVGVGTTVSPGVVSLGPVPAFPLLSALPDAGPTPAWSMGLLVVPVVVAAVGARRAQLAYGVTAYDSSALRGFGSGVLAGVLTALLTGLAGGSLGTGRLAHVGPSVLEVGAAAVASMGLAGLLAGLATAWWQRRSSEPVEH
ncbi:hypothetical protein EDD33_1001 [Nocardioides aurantiacus]|uniref:Uncharacterized protein n=2 Tax=Nocardioides aurantiacus TaxID=86796 RepID=A0A3N2CRW8_9ACTN|nr:hypothetical protein EDD33_1001 [Nocardioides aurantiacus]